MESFWNSLWEPYSDIDGVVACRGGDSLMMLWSRRIRKGGRFDNIGWRS
jgi:hypothetical protein